MFDKQIALENGLKVLSENQSIVFTRYVQKILPLDGFVFWVNAGIVDGETEPFCLNVGGSLHFSTNQEMREDENIAVNTVVFTTSTEIDAMNDIASTDLWIGQIGALKFSFNKSGKRYESAGLWHYVGDAVYPAFESQFIDDITELDLTNIVVSNSTPIWLEQSSFFPIYPSFLSPTNLKPPYATIHISDSKAINTAPMVDPLNSSQYQHIREKVRVTIYGVRHGVACDFIESVQIYCLSTDNMGIINVPVIQDERRPQSEVNALAIKKVINFEVGFWQCRMRDIAESLLKKVTATITLDVPVVTQPQFISSAAQRDPLDPLFYTDITNRA